MRGWKVSPNTAARRTTARSSGASASMRAIAAASAESGSPTMPARLDREPQQVAQELRIAAGALRHHLEHVRRQRAVLRRQLRHPQCIRDGDGLELDARDVRSLLAASETRGSGAPGDAEQPALRRQRTARGTEAVRPRPRPCGARSRSRRTPGRACIASRKRPTASCSFARRFSSASISTSGVELDA